MERKSNRCLFHFLFIEKEIGASCESGQCKDEFSVCYPTTNLCQCLDGYKTNGTECIKGVYMRGVFTNRKVYATKIYPDRRLQMY